MPPLPVGCSLYPPRPVGFSLYPPRPVGCSLYPLQPSGYSLYPPRPLGFSAKIALLPSFGAAPLSVAVATSEDTSKKVTRKIAMGNMRMATVKAVFAMAI
uniref:Uncharacterized protein n=1 Tax=Rhizophora mucronata TaxID=61149 RepID=A0A2P2J3G3_RHIMU